MNATTHKLSVTFTLVGATPSKLYQVGIVPFCSTFPATFGQFPVDDGGTCQSLTRQGVTATAATVELGVVTTDILWNDDHDYRALTASRWLPHTGGRWKSKARSGSVACGPGGDARRSIGVREC